jgi:flagellin-like protein
MIKNRNRGQSEVVGTLLLVGIVTLAISGAGSIIIFNIHSQEGNQDPLIECSIEYTDDNVTITNLGGESADIDNLTAILRNESSESRMPLDTTDGGGDSRFEPGDSASLGPISQETQILLVTENNIVCDSAVQPKSTWE